ncbi:MAG: transcription termination/antitermination protein NusA [Ruminococcaceae bacterium]|nr:transcription termination/antitermination protein NusA [Oscillospiraceae bacterium]
MNKEFFEALDALERERHIPKAYMIEKVEAALATACKRELGSSNITVVIDPEKQDMKVYRKYTIVAEVEDPTTEITKEQIEELEAKQKAAGIKHKVRSRRRSIGSDYEYELHTKDFRRLSAQNAKQVIIQGIREAERSYQAREYEDKKGEMISAIVTAVDPSTGNVTVDTGISQATLLKSEQIPGESLHYNDRIKVFATQVNTEARGPLVSLTRVHPTLVKRLFEAEVPEISEGTVAIKNISREAGSRTKIAVYSRDPEVDAVGSCIGNKGSRIGVVVNELNGEKIDVIPYSDDICEYIKASLSPATVKSVELVGERQARVLVSPDQLSLAIGKMGQNARLAARLTGCKIDIKSE